jgi:hypothetical protein
VLRKYDKQSAQGDVNDTIICQTGTKEQK